MGYDNFVRMWLELLSGLTTTLALTAITLVLGALVAFPIALAGNARAGALRGVSSAFIVFFRGPPLLVQMYLIYYGGAQLEWVRESWAWTILRDPFACAVIALSLNSAGFVAEILRGAIRSVPADELDAATSAGFSPLARLRLVVIPHMIAIALRAYGNEIVFVIKGTSVASLITINDLMGVARQAAYRTYDPFTPLLSAGLIYFVLVYAVTKMIARTEKRNSLEFRARQVVRDRAARNSASIDR